MDELRAHLDHPAGSFEAACESFGALNLERVGLQRRTRGRWYARTAEPLPTSDEVSKPGLPGRDDQLTISEVRRADELVEFESATCAAFGAPPPIASYDIHGLAILDDPAMHVMVAREVDGPVVAGAMAYVSDGVVGLYGVGTVPGHRGHGYGTAVTAACLALAPERTVILQPSAEAAGLYRRLGFVDIGPFSHWG
jgi:ribosomal protein S18 acetylase RimI-like enzyme